MTAVAARTTLARLGRDLMNSSGGSRGRRGAALARRLKGVDSTGAKWADLLSAPDWLRQDRAGLDRLARRVALLSMASAIARSIDGSWLSGLAERVGEEELELAMEYADTVPKAGLSPIAADELDRRGYGLLAAELDPALRCYLPVLAEPVVCDEDIRRLMLQHALAR